MLKNVIWSSDIDMDDWEQFLDEEYPDADENERYAIVNDLNNSYLDDERANLDIQLPEEIVVFGDIGTWQGTRHGHKIIKSGNIRDCLFDGSDMVTWYCDRYNMRCDTVHHDGRNHYLYRMFRRGLSEWQKDNFLANAFRDGSWNDRLIRRYTESIRPQVASVYGW